MLLDQSDLLIAALNVRKLVAFVRREDLSEHGVIGRQELGDAIRQRENHDARCVAGRSHAVDPFHLLAPSLAALSEEVRRNTLAEEDYSARQE